MATESTVEGRILSRDSLSPRWRGQPGRLEVWYATVSDPVTKSGCWIHHEVVAPVDGDPYVHGWTALFSADGPPVLDRFGPSPAHVPLLGKAPAPPEGIVFEPPHLAGQAGRLRWSIGLEDGGEANGGTPSAPSAPSAPSPIFTFPRWVWEREVLPAAQVVCIPSSVATGWLEIDGRRLHLSPESRGDLAHIYGHGSAERWGWLHAELGGGDVLEIVSAVSRRPVLNRLPPLAFVQLRLGGRDWPRDPLIAAPQFRTELALPTWRVRGAVGRFRLRAEVTIDEVRAVRVQYVDPDGATATCTNSETADTEIVLERRLDRRWQKLGSWRLEGTAHAEVGTRP